MFKVIIFDVGGVIINYSDDQYIAYLSKKLRINQRRIKRVLLPLLDEMDYGRMDLDHAEKIFTDHFNIERSRLEWVSAFRKLAKRNKKVIALIKRLSKNYEIGIITNISKSRYRESKALALDNLIKAKAVHKIIASSYVGMKKPHTKIYKYALKELNAKAKETIFIDNMKINVDGAKEVGITGIKFDNYKKLLTDLKKLGVS
jgi:epoxide hydrolase-like predicted phosphatase